MKKVFSVVAALTMCVFLAACDNNTASTTNNAAATAAKPAEIASKADTGNSSKSGGGYKSNSNSYSGGSDSLGSGEYWCMGKNDTCKNKTYSASDLYCYSCDPDNNNIEGDQRSSKSYGSGGKVIDNNYDGDVDEDDWEKAWGDYLDDKYDEYGF